MSSGKGQITIWLSYSIILLSAGLVCHVLSIPAILDAAGRDGWLSVFAASPPFLLFVLMMYRIIKRLQGQKLADWITLQFGAVPSWLLRISSALLLLELGTDTLFETSAWAVTTYLQFTPLFFIVALGVLIPALAAYMGIRSIAMTTGILLPFVLLLGYFVMTANMRYKDYSRLQPMLEHGVAPVLQGAVYSLAGLIEIWVLLFFQHEVKRKFKLWHLMLLSVFMIGMAIGPTMSAITEFGPDEAAKQLSPPFEQWRLVNVGKLLQHVDFLSIYQWVCGSFGRVAISMYLIVDLLNLKTHKNRFIALSVISVIMGGVSIYWWRVDLIYEYVKHIQFPVMVVYVYGVTILLTLLTFIRRKDKEGQKDGQQKPAEAGPTGVAKQGDSGEQSGNAGQPPSGGAEQSGSAGQAASGDKSGNNGQPHTSDGATGGKGGSPNAAQSGGGSGQSGSESGQSSAGKQSGGGNSASTQGTQGTQGTGGKS